MGRYWLKIALGALTIFGIGMAVIAFAKPKIEHAKTVIAKIPAALEDPIPFKFEGQELGRIDVLHASVDSTAGTARVDLSMVLDSGTVFNVPACDFTVLDVEGAHVSPGFRCAPTPLPSSEWMKVGEITFQPSGETRALVLPMDKAKRMARRLSDNVVVSRDGSGNITVDKNGKRIVQITADSHGATMHVRDEQGREVVRMKADSAGFQLQVKDTSKH